MEEILKKDLNDPDNHDGVITHLEPDILECEVKWALGSITMNKASGADGIPVELFQNLKDNAVKVLHSIWPLFSFIYHLKNILEIKVSKDLDLGKTQNNVTIKTDFFFTYLQHFNKFMHDNIINT